MAGTQPRWCRFTLAMGRCLSRTRFLNGGNDGEQQADRGCAEEPQEGAEGRAGRIGADPFVSGDTRACGILSHRPGAQGANACCPGAGAFADPGADPGAGANHDRAVAHARRALPHTCARASKGAQAREIRREGHGPLLPRRGTA
jgi:hypothetical protein